MQVLLVENGALIFIEVKNPNAKTYFTQCGRLCSGSNKCSWTRPSSRFSFTSEWLSRREVFSSQGFPFLKSRWG